MNKRLAMPNRRQFFRYSLRAMLLLITGVCLLLGCLVNKAHEQRKAVAFVRQAGGFVIYSYQSEGANAFLLEPKLPGPNWLRSLIGIDFFSDVSTVYLRNTQVDDVTPLASFRKLEFLDLSNTQVKNLRPLAQLERLELLHLGNTQVRDVEPLQTLTHLKHLYLNNTPLVDVAPLAELTNLIDLHLSDTQVSNVVPLVNLTRLTDLNLTNSPITDESLQQLRQALPNGVIRGM